MLIQIQTSFEKSCNNGSGHCHSCIYVMVTVNPNKIMHQVNLINKPKKILRLWRSWAHPHHHHHHQQNATTTANKHNLLEAGEDYRESLFLGSELSDGSRRGSKAPEHVPKGSLAVYVGPELRRFVIPMAYLLMPEFRVLMDNVAEEYGFEHEGGLQIPCEEQDFEDILHQCVTQDHMMSKSKKKH